MAPTLTTRRMLQLLGVTAILAAGCAGPMSTAGTRTATGFNVVDTGIPELQKAMTEGRVTSRQLVVEYLLRIALYEDQVKAIITVNPNVLHEAEARDRERAEGRVRGPLHGIPIALKDNIQTVDMLTTGGAIAFETLRPPYDAAVTKTLREAGAVIIAKTVMTELANWVAGPPTPMPGNYSALAGYGLNPYDPRRDPREGNNDGRQAMLLGGSSSGIGTAASFWAANVGTETSGSILVPANLMMLVGIKPTVGRISRYGIIPLTADQDTAGPMARTVTDAAIVLGALEGSVPDSHDPGLKLCPLPANHDYTPFLKRDGLKGARIGIPRAFFYDALTPPSETAPRGGLTPDQARVMEDAIEALKREGAVIVDPADIPSVVDPDPAANFVKWNICAGVPGRKGEDAECSVVFKYGMKRDFNAWLQSLGPSAPVKTLTELRTFNSAHQARGAIKYGQAQLDISDEMDVEVDRVRYEADRAKDISLAGTRGIDAVMKAHQLDAILFPGASGANIAARPGYPTIIVPFGTVPNSPTPPFPEGFAAKPVPFGVSFTGLSCSEPRLIELGYAFEQVTKRRVPPPSTP
ncbi:MAG TPA: amidase family protein [Candidatus Methylomirabilis sp.]|nr:amidase family protein [Candidatus Methylomirabilis sp.]